MWLITRTTDVFSMSMVMDLRVSLEAANVFTSCATISFTVSLIHWIYHQLLKFASNEELQVQTRGYGIKQLLSVYFKLWSLIVAHGGSSRHEYYLHTWFPVKFQPNTSRTRIKRVTAMITLYIWQGRIIRTSSTPETQLRQSNGCSWVVVDAV
jgi:hypothetical protein